MATSRDLQRLEKANSALLTLEDDLISGRLQFGPETSSEVYEAIKQMLADLSLIRNRIVHSGSSGSVGTLVDQFDNTLSKFLRVVHNPTNEGIYRSVLRDVNELHSVLSGNSDENGKLKNELNRLRDLKVSYEKTIADMESKAGRVNRAATDLSEVAEKKTTHDWTNEYHPYVHSDESAITAVDSVKKTIRKRIKNKFVRRCAQLLFTTVGIAYLFVVNVMLYNGKSYKNTVQKWRFWRSAWLFFITILAISYLVAFWDYDIQKKGIMAFWLDKSKFLPLLAVVTIGFTFSARNFKISSHLLEQYRHRYVVAKTMHNLMVLDDLKGDQAMKSDVLQKGAKVLFEFRNTGYMNKSDNEQLTSKDLLELIKKES